MKFAIDIWIEQPEEFAETGALGCPDEEHHYDTLAEAWVHWITPTNAFHMQLTHYPNYEVDEWGDGNILAEGTSDDFAMLMGDGLEFGEWLSEEEE
jgi:hypothetical protein